MENRRVIKPYKALNPYMGVICRTIKSQYWKNSISNFVSTGTFGATGVIRKLEDGKTDNCNGEYRQHGTAKPR